MAKGKTKPRAKPEKKKSVKAPKQAAEQLSDQQRQTLLFSYRRKLRPLIAAEKMAKDGVRKMFELAKKEGITKKEIELAFLLETQEGQEKVTAQLRQILDVDRWMGKEIGTQLELFGKKSTSERYFEDGKRAALDDLPAKVPGHIPQSGHKHWLDGHADGRTMLNVQRAEGFKPLGEVVDTLIPPAPTTDGMQEAA